MYVCICSAVSDKAIRRAVGAGACSVRALKDELGVGANCGRCVPEARRLIEQTLESAHCHTDSAFIAAESLLSGGLKRLILRRLAAVPLPRHFQKMR